MQWRPVSPALPGARHDIAAARQHGIIDALNRAEIDTYTDTAYQGAGPYVKSPHRSRRKGTDTKKMQPLSTGQKAANTAHARVRAPGEHAHARLKNWRVLRKIRSSPDHATDLVNAIQTLILAG